MYSVLSIRLFLLGLALACGPLLQAQLGGPKGKAVPFTVLSSQPEFEDPAPSFVPEVRSELESLAQRGPFYMLVGSNELWSALAEGPLAFNFPEGRQLLYLCVGPRSTAGYELYIDKVEETEQTLEIYYHEGSGAEQVAQVLTTPSAWLVVPATNKVLQLRKVPYTLGKGKPSGGGKGLTLNYKQAQGIVYTEYRPLQTEVPLGDE